MSTTFALLVVLMIEVVGHMMTEGIGDTSEFHLAGNKLLLAVFFCDREKLIDGERERERK